ncbi:MAG: aldo/keto reductase [Actinomycetota bacterium]
MTTPVITPQGAVTPAGTAPMALGTMYFGTTVPVEAVQACLDTAFELGARFWDTANNYAFWAGGTGDESETALGNWLHQRGPAVREEMVLATKLGARPRSGGTDVSAGLGLSAPAVRYQVQESLRRLRTERIDLLYAHIDDRTVPFVETLGALSGLVEDGLVRQIAASNLTPPRLQVAIEAGRSTGHAYAALQQRFSYLVPGEETDLSPHVLLDDQVERICTEADMVMLGYSPLLSGAYTRADRPLPTGYDTPVTGHALEVLGEVAGAVGLDTGQTVLAWMAQRDRPVLPVVGVSSPEQVASAWQAMTTRLEPGDLAALEAARSGG